MDLFIHNHILSFIDLIDVLTFRLVCRDWNLLIEHQVENRKTTHSTWIKTSRKLKFLFPTIIITQVKSSFTVATFGVVVSVQQIQKSHQIIITDCFKYNYIVHEFENSESNYDITIYYIPFQNYVEIEFEFQYSYNTIFTFSIFVNLLTFMVFR